MHILSRRVGNSHDLLPLRSNALVFPLHVVGIWHYPAIESQGDASFRCILLCLVCGWHGARELDHVDHQTLDLVRSKIIDLQLVPQEF